jgi:putative nucleotidyltransferase with HDIG domain
MDQTRMKPNIRRHSLLVAKVALIVGQALNGEGSRLSIPLILAGALLHDIAKTRCLERGGNHVDAGREMVLELGYPEVAWIVGSHVGSGSGPGDTIDEAAVVSYSDKRVQHDRVVRLEERLLDLVARYGDTPGKRVRLQKVAKNARDQERVMFSRIPFEPEDVESMIDDASPESLAVELVACDKGSR